MQDSTSSSQIIRICVTALTVLSLTIAGLLCVCAAYAAVPGRPLALPLPPPFPPIRVLTLLVGLHLIGLSFGLGGATMLDFWILRWMRQGSMPVEMARNFLFISKVVTMGIALLWISGLGFLGVYAIESPEKLANPKLWAKVTVVVALTVNGLLIHALVLPSVLRDVRRPMLEDTSHVTAGIFLVSGAVSGVSWYFAFALGLVRELNGTVGAGTLLALWGSGVVAAAVGAFAFREALIRRAAQRRGRTGPAIGQAADRPGTPFPTARSRRLPDNVLVSIRSASTARSLEVRSSAATHARS